MVVDDNKDSSTANINPVTDDDKTNSLVDV